MYGRPPQFGYGSGGGREAGPPPAPPPLPQPTTGANFNYNGFLQNLNVFCNGTSFNPGNVPFQSQNYQPQTPITYFQGFTQPQFMRPNVKEALEKIDREVVKARRDILVSGDNVSAWKVSQSVCLALKVDSWESLGFQMQQVPSLYDLIVTEGKINAFIHCFVGVRRITTLHDLELAICENEGIEKFVELDLGPLGRHPLVAHYFSVSSDIKDIFRITSEEIISCLHEFMTVHPSKEVKIDELLDFIAENRSLAGREKLNVRIQNLGRHIAVIRKATQSENITMMKHADALKEKFGIKVRRRPILSSQKQKLDDRYNNITERVQTFSGSSTKFCGKHIRFTSSSDEDDSSSTDNESNSYQNGSTNHPNLISQNLQSSDKVSSCPYPSVAEELERLGLKPEVDSNIGKSCCNKSCSVGESPLKRKSKASNTCGSSVPRKLSKRDENKRNLYKGNMKTESCTEDTNDSEILSESLLKFVAIWKETCCRDSVDQVLDKMLSFYRIKKKKKLQALLSSDPFAGLLDIALNSIKSGFFDSMHHTFKTFSLPGTENGFAKNSSNYVSIEVESGQRDDRTSAKIECGISIDDIIKKLSSYFEPDSDVASHANSTSEKKLLFLRKLCKLESWLIEQFSIKDFESFGYGDILTFIKGHSHLLPHVLQKLIISENSEAIPFEVCMLELQLDLLFSQASAGAWENGMISQQKILALLRRQFPSFCFKSTESNLLVDYRDLISEKELNIAPKCVLFSATMLKEPCLEDSTVPNENLLFESAGSDCKEVSLGSVTTKDAIRVLHTAPMLADLASWSHWDIIYAPSLGPLVLWLLNEVNTKELLCLVTRSGQIIRLDQSATLDTFLEVLLKGSSSGTALQLLSLLALYGGERNVPLHLLKCHVNRAFHVLLENSFEKDLFNANPHVCNELPKQLVPEGKRMLGNLSHDLNHDGNMVDKKVASASRFILDCLRYLPTEFCVFAASVLLSGFQSSFRDAPKAILSECNQVEQRIMLHGVGFSLGIVEWINDYHTFCSTVFTNSLLSLESPDSKLKSNDDFGGARFSHEKDSMCHSSTHDSVCTMKANCNDILNVNHKVEKRSEVSVQASDHDSSSELNLLNASSVIESIRRDEFGLDPGLSTTECKMLEKQHARLGRALHCLSHELYSQDSHFLLELVQNADDNIYPQNVEPSLVFVLQKKGIVVMNNEIGFSAENIRALCDVGNSTKKGQSAGYIGKKGIGFKSVFRVTDAPEIHSNGFHIKFDISKGQIGFVLPTVVSPCDTDFYSGLVMSDTGHANCNSWKTCIVLPFKKTLSDSFIKGNVISMFSDLHPSLLLFLHRLKCIIFRNMLTDSIIVMKKEVLMDGITRVSLGKERMHWLVVAQKLQSSIRPDVQSTEISVAFTLEETDDGGYAPQLTEQPVFAFLPLRTYGLKFILQGDFVLPSSREEVDGSSAWNQWLLSEFPGLFVGAERAFCDLPCFQRSLGKAVTAFMRFVPLLGEVQGFFSLLPRMIISKLRTSNCMLLDGDNNHWVPPCKVLRNWTEEARVLLPDRLLHEHLGLGFLNRDIVLSDSLAKALGIEDYGPKTLVQIISSLSNSESGLKLVSLSWLSSLINAIYLTSLNSGTESELISKLRKVPFVPLSDGKYSSIDRGTIWLHSGVTGLESENNLEAFPKLYAKLRTVSPELFSAAAAADKSCLDKSILENVTRMLLKVGVQKLSGHDIVKMHILPAISDTRNTSENTELMTEYLCFIMFHMQSGCRDCSVEREWIMDHLRSKALILTNYGYKQLNEVPIHFSREYGNLIPLRKLLDGIEFKWHEVSATYLRHPITKSLCDGVSNWRSFFMELSITDFVQIVQSEKCIGDLSHAVLKDMMQDGDLMSTGSVVKDWESAELVQLLSHLSSRGEHEKCKHLLEILDTFWDSYFSEKNIGYCNLLPSGERKPFKSSLVSILQNVRWMVSMVDKDFHYAKDLFHDCEAVRSILGGGAPYVVPKVKNQKLIVDLGLKSEVRLEDILMVITSWRRSKNPIKASISQMIRLYTFIWSEMTSSKQKTIMQLSSGPFIFVPLVPAVSPDDVVTGSLLSPKDVYWHDATGSMDRMRLMHPKCVTDMAHLSFSKILCNFYPTLHDFFVNDCGVEEIPPSNSYVQILLQLSTISLPSEAAATVFHVFSKWADFLTSGLLKDEDAEYLRETFTKKECAVLPTEQDKWVSLHPSFGLICWSDDEHLRKEFKHHDSIDLLYFGNLSDDEKKVLKTKVATLFRRLRIPALSEVVSREAIYYGATDSSLKASLVNWALPYAQRYIRHMYPDKYFQHGRSKFEKLRNLQIVVVERLFYRNVVKKCEIASKKRIECSCLLQENILYATRDSDSHSIFMELSHLLFGEAPDLHLANFIHLITTMVAAGSTEEQIELFILTSQKIPKLPVEEEPIWRMSIISEKNDSTIKADSVSTSIDEPNVLKSKRLRLSNNTNWPPVDWKTAPGFKYAQANGFKTQASCRPQNREATEKLEMEIQTDKPQPEMNNTWTFQNGPTSTSEDIICLSDMETFEAHAAGNLVTSFLDSVPPPKSVDAAVGLECATSASAVSNHLSLCTSSAQTMITGRLGEFVAFKYFEGKVGLTSVKWVNEASETGLPYDLVIENEESSCEFVEVKTTKSGKKNWFEISTREWQFAAEKRGSFSIAHVVLLENNTARVTIYKNPVQLCQQGNLRLAILIP